MKTATAAWLLILSILTAGSLCRANESVLVCGTGDSQDLLRILARSFEKSHPGLEVEVPDSIGSSGGIRKTAEGLCDLGRVARPLQEKEKKYHLVYRVFAFTPVVLTANANVTDVDNLTIEEITGIFSGRIRRWSELGGHDAPIYIAKREPGDSSRTILENHIPALRKLQVWAGETTYSTAEEVETVARYADTLGFAPLSMVEGRNLKVMKINTIAPTAANVRNGAYRYVLALALVWKEDRSRAAATFTDFLFSPTARRLILEHGALPADTEQ